MASCGFELSSWLKCVRDSCAELEKAKEEGSRLRERDVVRDLSCRQMVAFSFCLGAQYIHVQLHVFTLNYIEIIFFFLYN